MAKRDLGGIAMGVVALVVAVLVVLAPWRGVEQPVRRAAVVQAAPVASH